MKKILFLLLCTASFYGQTLQNPTYGTVKIKSNTATASSSKIVSQQPDTGELNYIDAENLPISTDTQAALDLKADLNIYGTFANRLIKFDGSGKLQFTNLISDGFGNFARDKTSEPIAPVVTDSGESGLLNGGYYYSVSYYNSFGETLSTNSTDYIIVSNKKVQISGIPISSDDTVIGRRIYRTSANPTEAVDGKKLLIDIPDNTTTTYLDNIADGSLGTPLKWNNTTSGVYKQNNVTIFDTDLNNLQIGYLASAKGYANTAVGAQALRANTIGKRNSAFSLYALTSNVDGDENTAGGVHAFNGNINGDRNTGWGYASFIYNLGSNNTGIGARVFENNVNGNGLVGLGNYAGNNELGSNKFYVDNQDRGSESAGRLGSLLYGEFSSTPSLQTLRANANFSAINISGNNNGDQLQTDVSDIKNIGFSKSTFFSSGAYPSNSPTGSDTYVQGMQFPVGGSNLDFKQILATNTTDLFFITQSGGNWNNWRKVVTSDNGTFSSSVTATSLKSTNLAGTGDSAVGTDSEGNLKRITSTDSRPYKVYTALLSQSGTSDPVATVLENTLGVTLTWTRIASGHYRTTISYGIWVTSKIYHQVSSLGAFNIYNAIVTSSSIDLFTYSAGSGVDSVLNNTPYEIRVYP